MLENKEYKKIKSGSNKNFGLVFSAVFLIIALYPLLHSSNIKVWSLIVFLILFLISFVVPNLLKYPNYLWFKFGLLLNKIISPLIMITIFYFVVTPIGVLMKIIKKDLIGQNINKNINTYWIIKSNKKLNMKDQF
tara:strand:- start:275 stop:679 length:405 start_codon:yes stop_codon:yes gene_type:complete